MKALITGVTGFVGSHLAELLVKNKFEVYGISRFIGGNDNLDKVIENVGIYSVDILDKQAVYGLVSEIKPDYIFHLAAQSYVPQSWKDPVETLEINVIGSNNLFEAVRQAEIDCTIQIACSSEEYGLVLPQECPINESQPLRPLSIYGVSKEAMDSMGWQYFRSYGLKIIRTRAFNHEGPRREQRFVISNFAKQIAEIEKGKRDYLRHGDLTSVRDFSDVRDIVKAYLLAVQKCDPGEVYNISSGEGTRIEDIVSILYRSAKVGFSMLADEKRMRPSDVPILIGNSTKFREKTGWSPEIPLEDTIKSSLDYWRKRV
jgi:GDP-4-dehydro-6-deoxy-D-mannose reductase